MLRIASGFLLTLLLLVGARAHAANTATLGPNEGEPAGVACPGDHYLAGVNLWWDTSMSGLSPYCVEMARDGGWEGGAAIHLDRMMSEAVSGKRLDMFCPRDFYLFAFSGGSHVYGIHSMMQLTLTCRNVKTGALTAFATTDTGVPMTMWPGGQCADNAVANGVFGTTYSARIIRFGLTCQKTKPAIFLSQMVQAKPGASLDTMITKKKSDMVVVQPPGGDFSDMMQSQDSGPKSSAVLKQPGISDMIAAGGSAVGPDVQVEPGPPIVDAMAGGRTFAPPLGGSGLRLYACQTVDGTVCDQPVADMFCQQQGYATADSYAVVRAKGPAETLSGQQCTKVKCKVFDSIVCMQ